MLSSNKLIAPLIKGICLFIVIGVVINLSQQSFAYDQHITHPALTAEIAKFFNAKNTRPEYSFSNQQITWIKQGAIDEDEPARWINHFYDPVHGTGWSGKHYGYLTQQEGYQRGASLAPKPALPSIAWATNQEYQSAYGAQFGNQTWQKAIKSYLDGDKQSAFIALGHVLHLIEDASVPDHTRDDSHPGIEGDPGSPYEMFSKTYSSTHELTVADDLIAANKEALNFVTLQDAFRSIANYSNNNFFSEDTISNEEFEQPKLSSLQELTKEVDNGVRDYLYKDDVYVAYVKIKGHQIAYSTADNYFVMPSYRDHLFPKAVLTGTSVVNLFFKEVEKYRQHPEQLETIVPNSQVSFVQALAQWPIRTVLKTCSELGEKPCTNLVNTADHALTAARAAAQSLASAVGGAVQTVKSTFGFGATASEKTGEVANSQPVKSSALPISPAPEQPFPKPVVKAKPPSAPAPAKVLGEKIVAPVVGTPVIDHRGETKPALVQSPNQSSYSYSFGGGNFESIPERSTFASPKVEIVSPTTTDVVATTSTIAVPLVSTNSTTTTILNIAPIISKDTTPPPAPLLAAMFNETFYTTSSSTVISGTNSTDTVKILAFYSTTTPLNDLTHPYPIAPSAASGIRDPSGSGQAGNGGKGWNLETNLSSGKNYYQFAALDAAGNTSSLSRVAAVILDNDPPPVPVMTIDNKSGFGSTAIALNLQGVDALSTPTNYDIDYQTGATTTWTPFVSSTPEHDFIFNGARGEAYTFRARARDRLGNLSAWSNEAASSTPVRVNWSNEVVVNEVAWAGTSADYPSDEWLELYNNTDQPIDLKNWKILVSGKPLDFYKINNSVIPARGYYLFERTSDNTIRNIPADYVYALANGFNNSGAKLEVIKPNGEKTDEVDSSPGWFAGDTVKYRSMERINTLKSGNDKNNWQSNQGPRAVARSYNGGPVYGTPKQSNFGSILLNLRQEESSRRLTKENNPYILQYYEIPAGFTLTVDPGVIIKSYYSDAKIDVYGNLSVSGTADNMAVFTSGRDHSFNDSLADATVGSWGGVDPAPKDWQGVWFHPGSRGDIHGLSLRYGGHNFFVNGYIYTGSVSQAVRAESAEFTLGDAVLSDNGQTSVHLERTSSTIFRSIFKNGERALEAFDGQLSMSDSDFSNFSHAQGPIYIKRFWPELADLRLKDNVLNLPFVESATLSRSVIIKKSVPLYLGVFTLTGSTSTLTIEPGAKITLADYSTVTIQGSLNAIGAADDPITIAPLSPANYWGNFVFTGSTSTLRYVNISGGNRLPVMPPSLDGMLLVNNSNLSLERCSLLDSRSPGNSIQMTNSNVTISDTVIGHNQKPSFPTIGIKANGGALHLKDVRFKNLTTGVFVNSLPLTQFDANTIALGNFENVDHYADPSNLFDPVFASVVDVVTTTAQIVTSTILN